MSNSNILLISLGLNFAATGFYINGHCTLGFLSFCISFIINLSLNKKCSLNIWIIFLFEVILSFVGECNLINRTVYFLIGLCNALTSQTVLFLNKYEQDRFLKIACIIEVLMIVIITAASIVSNVVLYSPILYKNEIIKLILFYTSTLLYTILKVRATRKTDTTHNIVKWYNPYRG